MFNIDGTMNAEKRINKMVQQTAMDLSTEYLRIKIISADFTLGLNDLTGPHRDGLITSMMAVSNGLKTLQHLGAQQIVDAIVIHNLDARDYYEKQGEALFGAINRYAEQSSMIEHFTAVMERFRPSRQELADELGDDAPLPGQKDYSVSGTTEDIGVNAPAEEAKTTEH